MDIKNVKIIVTGAASGMGKHFVERLLREGASVSAWDLDESGLNELKTAYPSAALHAAVVNVTSESAVSSAMDEAWSALGSINGLVNNAGIFRDALIAKRDRESREIPLAGWPGIDTTVRHVPAPRATPVKQKVICFPRARQWTERRIRV